MDEFSLIPSLCPVCSLVLLPCCDEAARPSPELGPQMLLLFVNYPACEIPSECGERIVLSVLGC